MSYCVVFNPPPKTLRSYGPVYGPAMHMWNESIYLCFIHYQCSIRFSLLYIWWFAFFLNPLNDIFSTCISIAQQMARNRTTAKNKQITDETFKKDVRQEEWVIPSSYIVEKQRRHVRWRWLWGFQCGFFSCTVRKWTKTQHQVHFYLSNHMRRVLLFVLIVQLSNMIWLHKLWFWVHWFVLFIRCKYVFHDMINCD